MSMTQVMSTNKSDNRTTVTECTDYCNVVYARVILLDCYLLKFVRWRHSKILGYVTSRPRWLKQLYVTSKLWPLKALLLLWSQSTREVQKNGNQKRPSILQTFFPFFRISKFRLNSKSLLIHQKTIYIQQRLTWTPRRTCPGAEQEWSRCGRWACRGWRTGERRRLLPPVPSRAAAAAHPATTAARSWLRWAQTPASLRRPGRFPTNQFLSSFLSCVSVCLFICLSVRSCIS